MKASRPIRKSVAMLIGSYWPEPEGGAERQCRHVAARLVSRGFRVTVLTCRNVRSLRSISRDNGVVVVRLGSLFESSRRWTSLLSRVMVCAPTDANRSHCLEKCLIFWFALPLRYIARLTFMFAIQRLACRRKVAQIVHVHESGWLAGIGVSIARRWRVPSICKEASCPALGKIGYDTPFRWILDRSRRRASGWIAQTPSAAAGLSREGLCTDRLHIVPNGVEVPVQVSVVGPAKRVLYVGNLTQGSNWKAFDVLFDAWIDVALADFDAQLIVAGEGDADPWRQLLKTHGVESSVQFVGYLDDLSPVYRSADIFVLPSRIEGMSNALLEAQSWGLPCVVSDIPGNMTVVEDGVNGLVVRCGDATALAEGVTRLLDDVDLRKKLGDAARTNAEKNYSIDAVVDRLIGIYNQLT